MSDDRVRDLLVGTVLAVLVGWLAVVNWHAAVIVMLFLIYSALGRLQR